MGAPAKRRVAIVGSGFGGSITAARLAESGRFEVEVLERGARYGRNSFPRRPDDVGRVFWDPEEGAFGFFEYRSFAKSQIDVLTASGLGGGSLIYSNVLYRMPAPFFATWPTGLRRETLDPYYDRALAMLEATPFPWDRPEWPYWAGTPKARALAEAAAKIAASPKGHPAVDLEWPPLAVQFGPEPGREVINRQGVAQTTCVMCAECNVGCNTHAKNTLDLNYLPRAERFGAVVRTHTAVHDVVPRDDGRFDLHIYDPRDGALAAPRRTETFDLVVLAAGSLGSTELVLRMRAGARGAKLSAKVGTQWSPNGDLLGFVNDTTEALEPTTGPVITGALHAPSASYTDGYAGGEWVEDGGIPAFFAWYLLGRTAGFRANVSFARGLTDYLARKLVTRKSANVAGDLGEVLFRDRRWTSHTLLMLGMGRDRATGTLDLSEPDGGVHLRWQPGEGADHYDRTRLLMGRIAEALGGELVENPLDDLLSRYISVHPLGGLPFADDPASGAVDARTAELFGVKNLFVVDGSILPGPVGPNPALTIAALAEMYAEKLCDA